MIVVRIEIWPFGNKEQARLLGLCKIANDGTGNKISGNYDITLFHSGKTTKIKSAWRKGHIKNHRRNLSVYHLVYKALKAALKLK